MKVNVRKKQFLFMISLLAAGFITSLVSSLGATRGIVSPQSSSMTARSGSTTFKPRTTKILPNRIVSRNFSSKHLVVSHFKESLQWLNEGWGSDYTHTVYEMGRENGVIPDFSDSYTQRLEEDGSRYYLTNWGDESSGYLRFIIDYYDDLPDITVFLHDAPEKHNREIKKWIPCLRPDTWFTYVTRSRIENRCIIDSNDQSLVPKFDNGAFVDYWSRFPWGELGLSRIPRCLSFYCCAQFALSREAIRHRPLSFYKALWSLTVNYVLDQNIARKFKGWSLRQIGGVFEHSWHVIFGETMMMSPYNYCDYYKSSCGPCSGKQTEALPPNNPESENHKIIGIRISEAWLAPNCHQPKPAEASDFLKIVKTACDSHNYCNFKIPATPIEGCPSDYSFIVIWLCPDRKERSLTISSVAMQQTAVLSCDGKAT